MSDLATIRAAVVAVLQAVPAIGVVHDYERYAAREGDFRNLYLYDLGGGASQIRGWFVRRPVTREVSSIVGVAMRVTTWRITGYMAIADAAASEKTFDGLIESACDAFRADGTLGGAVADLCDLTGGSGDKPYGIQVDDSGPVLFASTLCHRAMLSLVTSSAINF